MEFQTYVKGKQIIRATRTAYEAIYKAQGFILADDMDPPKEEAQAHEGTEGTDTGGSDGAGNAENTAAGKSKRPKS